MRSAGKKINVPFGHSVGHNTPHRRRRKRRQNLRNHDHQRRVHFDSLVMANASRSPAVDLHPGAPSRNELADEIEPIIAVAKASETLVAADAPLRRAQPVRRTSIQGRQLSVGREASRETRSPVFLSWAMSLG